MSRWVSKNRFVPCLWASLTALPLPVIAQTSESPAEAAATPPEAPAPVSSTATEGLAPAAAASDAQAPLAVIAVAPLATETPAEYTVAREDNSGGPDQPEEVVVTVTKRAQAVRDIPSSVAVLSGDKLEELGIRKLKDILALVPGINMQDEIAGIQRKVSVRGVGPDTGTNQTVGTVLGDVPISDPYGATSIVDPNPWDMKTVEVLKGPQGTLFGATSLAGLLRYVPNYPELDHWGGKAFVDYTTVDRGSNATAYGGAFNVPIGDSMAFHASGIYQHLPGVIDSDNPAREEKDVDRGLSWAGRAMALWQPTEAFTINAWYNKEERHADDLNIVTVPVDSYSRNDAPMASPSTNGYSLGTLDMRYVFDWASVVSVTGYQRKTSSNFVDASYLVQPLAEEGISFFHEDRSVKTHGLLQELRLVSPDAGPFTWIGGVYYATYSADINVGLQVPDTEELGQIVSQIPLPLQSLISPSGVAASTSAFAPLDANEGAVFGEANYDITDSLRLTLGSRLYETSVHGKLAGSGVGATSNGETPSISEKGFSPKAALTYRPWTDVMLYATASRGFQFGGFNLPTVPEPTIPSTFKSSTLWNYELGERTDFFDKTVRVDVTGFFLDWKNPQIQQIDPTGVDAYVDNVGGVHSLGVEATLRYLTPIKGLVLDQTASYIEARTTVPYTDANGNVVPAGTLMASSPLVQAVSSLTYTKALGPWTTQTSIINSYQGKAYSSIEHTLAVGDYDLLNVTFNVTRNDLPLSPSVTLSVNNLLNVQALAAGFGPSSSAESTISVIVAQSSYVYTLPRSIVLRAGVEF